MPVLVRNKEGGPTVFSIPEDNVQIEWQGAGDPNGGDIQHVPDKMVENVQFLKVVRQGILSVEDASPEVLAQLDKQSVAYRERTSASADAAKASIDQQVNNDLVQAPCIGPSTRGIGDCGEPVPVREKDLKSSAKPILCSRHASLAPQYAQVDTGEMVEQGDKLVSTKAWVRSTVAARESK